MDQIYYRVLLNDRIKIEPRYLSKGFRGYVLEQLRKKMEGRCTRHGYIREGSIEVHKLAPGNIELVGLNGSIVFDVHYYAEVCNPMIGNVVKATVTNMNKFGILAEANVLEIVIAKNSINIQHDAGIDINSIQIGSQVFVEVVGKKFELNDKKISIVGRLVTGIAGAKKGRREPPAAARDREEKEEEDEEPVADAEVEAEGAEEEGGDAEEADAEAEDEIEEQEGGDAEEVEDATNGKEFFDSEDEDLANEEYEFYSEQGSSFGDGGSGSDEDF